MYRVRESEIGSNTEMRPDSIIKQFCDAAFDAIKVDDKALMKVVDIEASYPGEIRCGESFQLLTELIEDTVVRVKLVNADNQPVALGKVVYKK